MPLFRLAEFIFTLLLGFASGFASGAFGIGGGVITTPAIRLLLQQPAGIALGTPLPVIFPSALVGGLNYWRAGKINTRVVAYCSLFGVAGTALGSGLTAFMDTRYIMIVTALLIFYLSWRTASAALGRELYACPEDGPEGGGSETWKLALIGLVTGFFSGFLGLGGGVIMVPAFFGNAFYIFLCRQAFLGIPVELEDAARIDGASSFRIYWQLFLPLTKPTLATVAIFAFYYYWNDLIYPLVYLQSQMKFPVSLGLRMFQGANWGLVDFPLMMAASMISLTPCLVLFFLAQRLFIQGVVVTGVKG